MPTSHIPKGNCGCVSGQSGVSLLLSLLTTKSLSLESPVLGVNKRSRSVHVDGDAQCLPLDIQISKVLSRGGMCQGFIACHGCLSKRSMIA